MRAPLYKTNALTRSQMKWVIKGIFCWSVGLAFYINRIYINNRIYNDDGSSYEEVHLITIIADLHFTHDASSHEHQQ